MDQHSSAGKSCEKREFMAHFKGPGVPKIARDPGLAAPDLE